MAKKKFLTQRDFFAGQVRDDKSRIRGAASNIEELDIFSNADFIIPEQIFSSDSLPASTEAYAYASDNADNVWAYGKETTGSKVRLLKLANGGNDNPGSFATDFTSADGTDLAYVISPLAYLRRDDGNQDFLYYLTNASGTVRLKSYDITAQTESETDSGSTAMTLTGLDGTNDRTFMVVMFGELLVGNGQFIAKIDKDGVFTEKAFTLPNGWEAIDLIPVSDVGLILARNINRRLNQSKGFWWDLTTEAQVDDSFDLPMGGPQWVVNHQETIKMMCAINGTARIFQLTGAFPGAIPRELPGISIDNVAAESNEQPISSSKMVSTKDKILYFGLNKTNKTGVYALGQLDSDKPVALLLSKRFATSDYANHSPTALLIHGPNYFGAFDDNGTASTVRCETANSPARSSNAVYETIWVDDGDPETDKHLTRVRVTTYPIAASTAVAVSIETDYSGSFTLITRADGTAMNGTNDKLGVFESVAANIKVFKTKLAFTSNSTDAPKVTSIGWEIAKDEQGAHK